MEQKPMNQQCLSEKKTGRISGKARRLIPVMAAFLLLSVQSAQAAILDRLQELGSDVESWVNVLLPVIFVVAFFVMLYYILNSSPKWRPAFGVFLLALVLWGGYDEIKAAAFKIGGGNGTIQLGNNGGGGN